MNHLRALLDQFQREACIACGDDMDPKEAGVAAGFVQRYAEQAICFDAGDIPTLLEFKPIPDLCVLPYETCWIEGQFTHDQVPRSFAVLVHVHTASAADMLVFLRLASGRWHLVSVLADVDHASGNASVALGEFSAYCARAAVRMVRSFCTALNCSNVRRIEHRPTGALQKARARRGKQPLFSYWTLHLNDSSETLTGSGGTHASPRVHLRRGHAREFQPGRWTWVQPCVVGNPKSGMVHKDYKLNRKPGASGPESRP